MIHWDKATETKVVLEQPQILESYILMPVFGFPTLDVFKRRLYVRPHSSNNPVLNRKTDFGRRQISGFDSVSHHTLGESAEPEVAAWGTQPPVRSDHHVELTIRKQSTLP